MLRNLEKRVLFLRRPNFKGIVLSKQIWKYAASSQPSFLFAFLTSIFGICLCSEVLDRQLDHQSDYAVASIAAFVKF